MITGNSSTLSVRNRQGTVQTLFDPPRSILAASPEHCQRNQRGAQRFDPAVAWIIIKVCQEGRQLSWGFPAPQLSASGSTYSANAALVAASSNVTPLGIAGICDAGIASISTMTRRRRSSNVPGLRWYGPAHSTELDRTATKLRRVFPSQRPSRLLIVEPHETSHGTHLRSPLWSRMQELERPVCSQTVTPSYGRMARVIGLPEFVLCVSKNRSMKQARFILDPQICNALFSASLSQGSSYRTSFRNNPGVWFTPF
jgi:hypothetical protein